MHYPIDVQFFLVFVYIVLLLHLCF